LAARNPICGKLGEFGGDLVKRQPDPLGKDNKGDAAQPDRG
jgi:hypothetical protein